MRGLHVNPGGSWSFVRRPEHRTYAVLMFAFTLVLAVPLVVMAVLWPEVWLVFIVLAVPAIAGLVFMRAGGRIHINPAGPSLRIDDDKFGASGFTAVVVDTSTRTVQTEHGSAEVREWAVELVRVHSAPGRTQAMEIVRAGVEQASELSSDTKSQLLDRFEEHREFLERSRLPLVTSARQFEVWQLGTRLSRSLKLPLVDLVDGERFDCMPAQLDMPLVDRLAARERRPQEPGASPGSAEVERSAETLRITWHHRVEGSRFGLGFGIFILVLAGGFSMLGGEFGLIGSATFGVFGLGLIVTAVLTLRGDGPNVLELDRRGLRHTTSRPWRRVETISLEPLRRIRPSRLSLNDERAFVSLMAADRATKIGISSSEVVWLWRVLEHGIASLGSHPQTTSVDEDGEAARRSR